MSTCPKCGSQNVDEARFCHNCGSPIVQPSVRPVTPSPAPYYTFPARQGMRSEEKVVIAVVLLVAILVVGGVAAAFVYFTPTNLNRVFPRPGAVTVAPLVLVINYSIPSDSYFGGTYRALSFLPISLQHNEQFQAKFTLTLGSNGGAYRSVDRIVLGFSLGFTIRLISPSPPFTVSSGNPVNVAVTIQAPGTDYSGPVTVDVFTH